MAQKGTNPHKAPAVCMVAGCERSALFVNPMTSRRAGGSRRGYCRKHKEMAKAKLLKDPR